MKKLIKYSRYGFFCSCLLLLVNCIEPFEVETNEFKSALVIEGTITDTDELQYIKVSQSFPLDTVLMSGVSNAKVSVLGSNGDAMVFTEIKSGEYQSNTNFAAIQGVEYALKVETPDGKIFSSEKITLPAKTSIDELYAVRDFKDDGAQEGMFIYIDSYDPLGLSKYYKYEYVETYKVMAPFWSAKEAYVVSPFPNPEVATRAKSREERVAYNSVASNTIIQESTIEFGEDRVSKFPVRFISRNNFIIAHRYSILVRQFVQNNAAFRYYETLESLSGSESLFSQIQAGFLEGNIKSDTNPQENVIGFFQLSTVSEKRLFFNFSDFFPNEKLPDYPSDCFLVSPALINASGRSPLIEAIEQQSLKYVDDYDQETNPKNFSEFGPFLMIQNPCGDSTFFGSSTVPNFWIED